MYGVRYESWRIESQARRERLIHQQQSARTELPLRWWRQVAHLTVPASDLAMATKAVEGGVDAAERILARWGIDRDAVAETFGIPRAELDAAIDRFDRRAPVVVLDGEDAQAPDEQTSILGRQNAATLLREGAWGSALRFWRPSGLSRTTCIDDLGEVVHEAARDRDPAEFPLDAIVWPKAESVDELAWLMDRLEELEVAVGLPVGGIKVQFLVEGGAAIDQVDALARACAGRLTGIVYGIADHAADLGLPDIRNDHPVADWARVRIVNAAGAAGVPAIDSMTLRYPVPDKQLDQARNRALILERMKECFDDARHGFALGMSGKWVGHPLQLVSVLAAAESLLPRERIEKEVARVEAYRAAVASGQGTTVFAGEMNDRAHDRQARTILRRAVALGRLDADTARRLGLLGAHEVA